MKVEQLTFTRFVAAMLVVLFHIGASSLDSTSVIGSLLRVGNSAVSYFFVLSGFILVVSSVRDGQLPTQLRWREFWRNRFARIYPLYLFALILTTLLISVMGSHSAAEHRIGSVIASTFLVQSWWPPYAMALNFPGWSLSVELLFYLLFPLLFGFAVRQPSRVLLVIAGMGWVVNLAVHQVMIDQHVTHNLTLYFPPLHLSTFFVGLTAGVIFVRHQPWLVQHHHWLTAVFFLLLALSIWSVLNHLSFLHYHHNGLFAPLFVLFIFWLSGPANWLTQLLSRPLLVRLGEISYGIYLLQVPVAFISFYINSQLLHWPTRVYVPVHIGLLIVVSDVCYRGIEQPARRLIRQRTARVATKMTDKRLSRQV